ncbi:MAG: hypothetical protein WA936_01450 [Erythrobacter sp.]|uniref:hypothetical protein n=1 Tax=Erythrobacter sp. TaxID=1042 RepID=UPI003C72F32C
MRAVFLLPLVLGLAACDQQEAGPVDSEVSPTSGADDEQTLPGERSLADETRTGPTRAADAAGGIPRRFQGVWDYAQGICDPASDLRVEIEDDRITFYESLGEVDEVTVRSPSEVAVELDMEGEGESWENTLLLTLSDDGETLTPRNADGSDNPMPRTRCD